MASLKKCENCDKDIYTNIKKCPYCGAKNNNRYKKKEKNKKIGIFFIEMVILFIIVDLFVTIIPVLLGESVFNFKYGKDFIVEALWCLCILIILLMSGNSYVFTCKKEEFGKAIKLGLPMLIISIISLLGNILVSLDGLNIGNLVNLMLFCISIGLTEEFLCRGWIQNEFIERYGNTRKNVITSIILASLVFGIMHITNILAGQGVFETIMQIIQATALGALLGSVYYRSKNIWAVAFLHAFFDFSLMLGEVNLIKDCTTGTVTNGVLIYQSLSTLILIGLYIFYTVILLRKKDTHKLIDEKSELTEEELKKDQKITNFMIKGVIVLVILLFLPIGNNIDGMDEYEICYSYEEKNIDGYETHFSNYDTYEIYYDQNEKYTEEVLDNVENIENAEISENLENIENTNEDSLENIENSENNLWENNPINNIYKFELYYDEDEGKLAIKNVATNYVVYVDNEYVYDYLVTYNEGMYTIMYYDGNEVKVYYSRFSEKELNDSNEFLDNLKESFKSYDVPEISRLGYLTYYDNDENYYTYAYMISDLGNEFIIDENDDLYLLN